MKFSLSLDWCGNSSYMRCDLDLYIRQSNDRDPRLFHLLTWMVWRISSNSWDCCVHSIFLGSAISWGLYWPGVVYRWLLRLGPGPKTFQQYHAPYSLVVFQSIAHHCISGKCSSTWYMMLVLSGEGFWWR